MIVLVVLIRRRKRKRVHSHTAGSPGPMASPEGAFFHKNSQLFSPASLLSPQSIRSVFNDPLEFPRNQLYIHSNKVLGMQDIE